jgi:proteasome accessory factor B
MAAEDRFERVTNLVTFLLNRADKGATFAEILDEIPGWPETLDAQRRAFERDKRVLRDEGIPLIEERGTYRIPPDQFYLPDLDLTADEQVALRLAVAAVPIGGESAGLALHKIALGAGEWEGSAAVVAALDEQPLLPLLHGALRRRSIVTFTYRGARRDVEPALLLFRDGYWYLAGHDRTRDERRTFRVDRIEGDVALSEPHAFEARVVRADEVMPRERWLIGGDKPEEAVLHVDAVLATKATADAGNGARVEPQPDGSVLITMSVTNRAAFRAWVLGMLDHAVVLEPAPLREDLVQWLERIAG